ncbi:gamma-aminobutyric acid receptor subunit rho-1-like [Palaemon carinicauda]|uniref:gamma-aminobutyric acid receptor subunit rho-1-like n=1 Tax=Palaemon carinicauda TaxID=392227 RepID=UPI0035B5B3B0
MRAFPFDAQQCWINITVRNAAQDSMRLSARLRRTDDSLNLNEYDVLSRDLTVINGTMVIRVILRRYPEYHILSSYFPVFLLHLLGYGTLFIDPKDFQDRGTMSLTSLLVLISFYSDTANSLPKTSYLKLLDIWYIFSVTFLSLIIGVHLATNKVDKQKDPSEMNSKVRKVLPMPKGISDSVVSWGLKPNLSSSELKAKIKRSYNASVLFVAQILFGLMYVIFHVLYWSKVFDNSLIF